MGRYAKLLSYPRMRIRNLARLNGMPTMMNAPTSVLPSDRQQAGICYLLVDYGGSLGSLPKSWARSHCLS